MASLWDAIQRELDGIRDNLARLPHGGWVRPVARYCIVLRDDGPRILVNEVDKDLVRHIHLTRGLPIEGQAQRLWRILPDIIGR